MNTSALSTEIKKIHDDACARGQQTYIDPATGYTVLTRLAHELRGSCCGNACRHCPYDWKNVPRRGGELLTIIIISLIGIASASAQQKAILCDTVKEFHPGTGQYTGQGATFFPRNVLTGPAVTARQDVPSTDPREICSIGLGGSITLGLRSAVIIDGPGADLTVFENAFFYGNGRVFAEPATIELSRDGNQWTLVPFDSLTLQGLAGLSPTLDPQSNDPSTCGGTPVDLSQIGIDSVRWIRLTDVTRMILSNPKSPFYDPTLSGFDLDAIRVWNSAPMAFELQLDHDPAADVARCGSPRGVDVSIYDIAGQLSRQLRFDGGIHEVSLADLAPGCYLVMVHDGSASRTLKVQR